jgi:hypothetical protein
MELKRWKIISFLLILLIYTWIVTRITLSLIPARDTKIYYVAQYYEEPMPLAPSKIINKSEVKKK